MKYRYFYKVKPEYDGKSILITNHRGYKERMEIFGNELFTFEYAVHYNMDEKYFDRVRVSVDSIYWFFGSRFSDIFD
ncbi:MAG: hypothetical protein J6S67_19015 [Methanobrevibacter sp.]|nr:hypothetical protein [Methanobrevibacter sp.]